MPRAKIRVRVRGAHSGAKVIDAILPGKVRTTYNKRVPVPETDTGGLGGRQRRPPSGGARAISEIPLWKS
ncbi:unnamed protein product [Lathyrus oleraceus]